MLDRAIAAKVFQIVEIEMPVVDLIAALAQQIADQVLARALRAAGRGNRDEVACGRKLRIETGIDGIQDFLLCLGVHRRCCPCCRRRAPIKAHFGRGRGGDVAFRIAEVSIQFAAPPRHGDAG